MKKTIVIIWVAVALFFNNLNGQAIVKNPSDQFSVEVSYKNSQIIIGPSEKKTVNFLPPSGEIQLRLRYFSGSNVKQAFSAKINLKKEKENVLPLSQQSSLVENQYSQKDPANNDVNFKPTIPQVSGTLKTEEFDLYLVDSADVSLLVFEGDFYGAALSPNQKSGPIKTKPGIISMKILYDADPPYASTGKNIWQVPIQGIVTQGQELFVIRKSHLQNLQRSVTKVVFYNPTNYTMICENVLLDIDPIPPKRRSKPVKLNQGFNNVSFVYINENGVKVRAVFELAVSRGFPIVYLQPYPLGNFYDVK